MKIWILNKGDIFKTNADWTLSLDTSYENLKFLEVFDAAKRDTIQKSRYSYSGGSYKSEKYDGTELTKIDDDDFKSITIPGDTTFVVTKIHVLYGKIYKIEFKAKTGPLKKLNGRRVLVDPELLYSDVFEAKEVS